MALALVISGALHDSSSTVFARLDISGLPDESILSYSYIAINSTRDTRSPPSPACDRR